MRKRELLMKILGHRSNMSLLVSDIVPFVNRNRCQFLEHGLCVHWFDRLFRVAVASEAPTAAARCPNDELRSGTAGALKRSAAHHVQTVGRSGNADPDVPTVQRE